MKRLSILILFMASCSISLFAQQIRTIRVSAGEDVAKAYSPQGFYRFSQFEKANLFYRGGAKNSGQSFNYNILTGNMQFIGPNGDTLNLAGVAQVDSIVLGQSIFLYKDGFVEVIGKADSVLLLKRVDIKTQTENVGGYGLSSPTASIVNVKSYTTANGVYSLVLNQDVVVSETTIYYFLDKNNNLIKTSKSNIAKVFSTTGQSRADAYLKQNKVNFDRENDLKKLMEAIAKN